MIKLENITPKVYYNQSRDFQFIGRLYDIIFNSVKTNTELIYSLPLSDDSDTRLIDLMATTLGFQSKHNYNNAQLKSLCSTFAYVIRNKGNLTAIYTACRALLNAEGITEDIDVTLSSDNLTINLFIPPALTDINLLKDLLTYILPAGMSCNLIKEARYTYTASTEAELDSNVTIYENLINNGVTDSERKMTLVGARDNTKSIIPELNTSLGRADTETIPGFINNSNIYIPDGETVYGITFITDGGKLPDTWKIFTYKFGDDTITLPTPTRENKKFLGWFDINNNQVTEIKKNSFGDYILTAKWGD